MATHNPVLTCINFIILFYVPKYELSINILCSEDLAGYRKKNNKPNINQTIKLKINVINLM